MAHGLSMAHGPNTRIRITFRSDGVRCLCKVGRFLGPLRVFVAESRLQLLHTGICMPFSLESGYVLI